MSNLDANLKNIYDNMPYYNELFAGATSIELPNKINPNDPINGVSKAASLALEKLQEQLAKVSLPSEDILDKSKSPTKLPTMPEVIDKVLNDLENNFTPRTNHIATELNGKCINEQINGSCDLKVNVNNKLEGTLKGTVEGKGSFECNILTDYEVNTETDLLISSTNGIIKGVISGNCAGVINIANEITIQATITLIIDTLQLTSNQTKNIFTITLKTDALLDMITLTNADQKTKDDMISKDVVGCYNNTLAVPAEPGSSQGKFCISYSIADLLNLSGVSFPSISMLFDSLRASLPLIIKYVPCLSVIIIVITIIIGIIKIVFIILEILFQIKPIVELVRKVIHSVAPPTIYATAPELASDLTVLVLAILKEIILRIPLLLWNLVSNKKILVICPSQYKPLC
jgi:hypothetical protein